MENLTKQQIVLLTLLVSFVTSIATGIVTVALMSQAPVGITQTINRVVERTIEKVVSEPSNPGQTVVKETVVVRADDLVVDAIDKNAKSVMRIFKTNSDPAVDSSSLVFVALGVVISSDGIIATDNNLISEGGKYFAILSDDKLHNLKVVRSKPNESVAFLKPEIDDKKPIELIKVNLSSIENLKLGQTVIYIGGESKNSVSTGIVSSLGTKEIVETSTTTAGSVQTRSRTQIVSIETNIPSYSFMAGAPILNLSGEIVGMKATISGSSRTDLFIPVSFISNAFSTYIEEQKKVTP